MDSHKTGKSRISMLQVAELGYWRDEDKLFYHYTLHLTILSFINSEIRKNGEISHRRIFDHFIYRTVENWIHMIILYLSTISAMMSSPHKCEGRLTGSTTWWLFIWYPLGRFICWSWNAQRKCYQRKKLLSMMATLVKNINKEMFKHFFPNCL